MHPANRTLLLLASALVLCAAAPAQTPGPPPLRLDGLVPSGARTTATEGWGTYDFSLTNLGDTDRQARVLVFFAEEPDVQYGRDLWVPARATVNSWLLVGPAPAQAHEQMRDFQILLYDRTGGKNELVLPPGEERTRSRRVLYRKRETATAVLLDDEPPRRIVPGRLPQPETPTEEARRLVYAYRHAGYLSEGVQELRGRTLPPTAEGFEAIDQFVLASPRIAEDPAGMRALRHWLHQGGRLWVMLDLVGPDVVAPLLGDALDFQAVDRVGLNRFRVEPQAVGQRVVEAPLQQHEQPVELVRVQLPAHEKAPHTVNCWPAWFTRQVGQGKVVFTALGPRGWYRPRASNDPKSPFRRVPDLPVPSQPLQVLAGELQPPRAEERFPVEAFQPLLAEEVGYSVVGRGTVALLFGAPLLAALGLGLALRRTRRPEVLGWLGPAAALGAAGVFLVLGETSRRAVPPTAAVAQVVEAVPGAEDTAVRGLLAVYRPESGPAELGANDGGFFDLDVAGLEGQTRRLILDDVNVWHWESLALPAGVRTAPFRYAAPAAEPITAVGRFGPRGVEGKLSAGPFRNAADAILTTPGGRALAVRLNPDGTFLSGNADVLPPGQYLAGALLDDRQQRRQALYREFLKRPADGRTLLLAWADPIDTHFTLAPGGRTAGTALLAIPLRLERPAPGTRVTIPAPLIPYRRLLDGAPTRPLLVGHQGIEMHLRFQLPPAVLPLKVEQARFTGRIDAPSRRLSIAGRAGDGFIEVLGLDSPRDPVRIDLTDERYLRLDDEGGLHLRLSIGDAQRREAGSLLEEEWSIEYLEVEVSGTTAGGGR